MIQRCEIRYWTSKHYTKAKIAASDLRSIPTEMLFELCSTPNSADFQTPDGTFSYARNLHEAMKSRRAKWVLVPADEGLPDLKNILLGIGFRELEQSDKPVLLATRQSIWLSIALNKVKRLMQ